MPEMLLAGEVNAGTWRTAPVPVVKFQVSDHALMLLEFFACTRQKYFVVLLKGPISSYVSVSDESLMAEEPNNESVETWRWYVSAFTEAFHCKRSTVDIPAVPVDGEAGTGAANTVATESIIPCGPGPVGGVPVAAGTFVYLGSPHRHVVWGRGQAVDPEP